MKNRNTLTLISLGACLLGLVSSQTNAAIALDRTRVIFDGDQKSISLTVSNENKQLPYLAQAWLEDVQGNKIQQPLTALPPVQRIEPGATSQVKLRSLPGIASLPQDRETLYYFNLREIPPRSDKPNTLQLALQTRIKLFYRPKALKADLSHAPWQENLTLTRSGAGYRVHNPTPYYVTLSEAYESITGAPLKNFEPVMVEPYTEADLKGITGSSPILTYINDYGGRVQLKFACTGSICTASPVKKQ